MNVKEQNSGNNSATTSMARSAPLAEVEFLRHESQHARAAIGASLRRIRALVGRSRPLDVVKKHPVIVTVAAAGITAIVIHRMTRTGAGQRESRPRRPIRQRWWYRTVMMPIKLLITGWFNDLMLAIAGTRPIEMSPEDIAYMQETGSV